MREEIVYRPISELHPYKHNPRKNKQAVDPLAASIKEYGFKSPIQITANGEIINGHTRFLAAKKLGLKEIPCVVVDDLTEEQIKEYRLIDNKTSEYASWDKDLLAGELMDLDFGGLDFDFDFSGDVKKEKRWTERKQLCDLKDRVVLRKANGSWYHGLMKAGDKGYPLADLKVPENVGMFADGAVDFIRATLGGELPENGWCLLTTPRRRHLEGFHFATAVCEQIAADLRIPFYEGAVVCKNRARMEPVFSLKKEPEWGNVILYDDIITTGITVETTRKLLQDKGYSVLTVISIDNH